MRLAFALALALKNQPSPICVSNYGFVVGTVLGCAA